MIAVVTRVAVVIIGTISSVTTLKEHILRVVRPLQAMQEWEQDVIGCMA